MIYIASSWRNQIYDEVIKQLTDAGFEVYDFKKQDGTFHWSEISSDWKNWNAKDFCNALKHQKPERAFKNDYDVLKSCDVCIMVLPCGRSAHLELGFAAGRGATTIILLPQPGTDPSWSPELMYKCADYICSTIEEVLMALETVENEGCPEETRFMML